MQLNPSHVLGGVVDRLAIVKAEIARLQAEEKALKEELSSCAVTTAPTIVEGMYHRAAISLCEGRVSIDWRAIAEHFNPSRQLVTAHTSKGEDFVVVRLSARKTS